MKTDQAAIEFDMFVRLFNSAIQSTDGFNADMMDRLKQIATDRHCGNGYYSWDGMLDDLAELTGSEDVASEILNRC